MRRAALFDMDRTLVRVETASRYVRYQRRIGEASAIDLARTLMWVVKYTFGLLDAPKVAARLVKTLEGTKESAMEARCEAWFASDIEQHIAEKGREAVARHRERGDLCAIVTGASPYAARPLAKRLGVDHVVTTVFETDERGNFTGRYVEPLCIGEGKVHRAARFAEEQGFELRHAAFYTDSITDLPLLECVAEPVVVNPDPRLLRVAKKRGYRIESW